MAAITELHYGRAFELAREFIAGNITASTAVRQLTDRGMNRSSAQGYLRTFAHMLRGERFRRTISNPAARYALDHIRVHDGEEQLRLALLALRSHLDYYRTYGSLNGLMKIVESFEGDAQGLQVVQILESRFDDQVRQSQKLSRAERLRRIAGAERKPQAQMALVRYFLRNADVKAEVLLRAGGVCEECKKPAPFNRISNLRPYLEVHHSIPLAEGGDDTVENSIAVCPNCHREAHYGANRDRFRLARTSLRRL